MPGVRIQHATARSVTLTLVDGSRPYREPMVCLAPMVVRGERRPCARTHTHKTYHLSLDETGAAIVSAEVWGYLRRIPGNPFVVANEVAHPPDQVIHLPRLRVLPSPIAPGARHVQVRS